MMEIRRMEFDDIGQVAAIERENSLTPWNETGLFTYLIRDDTLFLVACGKDDPEIQGYAGLLMVPYEADITNITVRKECRNLGVGTALLEELFKEAAENGVTDIHLEVRESSAAARHLYKKLGFTEDGIRKDYYTDPPEDAVTMTRRTADLKKNAVKDG